MSKPHFYGIGAQKAGTTWLYDRLSELSEFSLPYKKELHYFDRSKDYPSPNFLHLTKLEDRLNKEQWRKKAKKRLRDNYLKLRLKQVKWFRKWYYSDFNDEWYTSLFDDLDGITGDITPAYSILKEEDIIRMKKISPEAKIIFLMRNPIDRSWSFFRFKSDRTSKKGKTFDYTSVDKILEFMKSDGNLLRSDYIRTIDLFEKHFNKDHVYLGYFDDIRTQPQKILSDIVTFLGADPSKIETECHLTSKSNVSSTKRIPEKVYTFLVELYTPMMKELAQRYGGYCQVWFDESQRRKIG